MMPASRAVWSGSPFLTAPDRIWRSASRDIVIRPRATASRDVTGLALTSTIVTAPRGPTCESPWTCFDFERLTRLRIELSLCQKERQAFERHRQIHALQFH